MISPTLIRVAYAFSQDRIVRSCSACPVYGLPLRSPFCDHAVILSRLICAVFLLFYVDVTHVHSLPRGYRLTRDELARTEYPRL
jgi:hypothetical protein